MFLLCSHQAPKLCAGPSYTANSRPSNYAWLRVVIFSPFMNLSHLKGLSFLDTLLVLKILLFINRWCHSTITGVRAFHHH